MQKSNKPIIKHIPDFLDYCEVEKGLSQKTQENYHRYLKSFSLWLKKTKKQDILPHQLTSEDIWQYRLFLARYVNPITGKPLEKVTQNYYLIALRRLLKYFADKDILSLPPEKITLSKSVQREKIVKFLTLEQIKKLLSAPNESNITGLRDKTILETLFSTGLRVAELVSLNREQFANIKNKEDFEVSIIGKGNRPRTVYFSKRALEWLKKYLATRNDKEKALFVSYKGKEKGKRITARSVERIVKKYSVMAGIPVFTTPHILRHSFATDLLTQGVDLRMVQEFLGHKNIVTTQIYTHVTNKKLKDIHKHYHSGEKLGS